MGVADCLIDMGSVIWIPVFGFYLLPKSPPGSSGQAPLVKSAGAMSARRRRSRRVLAQRHKGTKKRVGIFSHKRAQKDTKKGIWLGM